MYKNMKIRGKLLLAFAIVILLSATVVTVSVFSLSTMRTTIDGMFTGPYISSTESMGLRRDLNAIGNAMRSAILEKNSDNHRAVMDSADDNLDARLAKIRASFHGEAQLVNKLEAALTDLNAKRRTIVTHIEAGQYNQATEILLGDYVASYAIANDLAIEINTVSDSIAGEYHTSSLRQVDVNILFILVLFGTCVVLAIYLSIFTTKRIVRPLAEVEKAAQEISRGNFQAKITYDSRDEIGQLAKGLITTIGTLDKIIGDIQYVLGEMANGNFDIHSRAKDRYVGDFSPILRAIREIKSRLSDTLAGIDSAAAQVAASSEQVSDGAQELSQGTAEQASAVEELAMTVDVITKHIQDTSNSADQINVIVERTGNQVVSCDQEMTEMVNAMKEISGKSGEIQKIIKTIEDIAFQTNILALNAAVEAARAGAAGKGFAVVADEVRSLATKSQDAAKGTTELIADTLRAVDNGQRIADTTASSLKGVVEGANQITATMKQITIATREQAQSAEQVSSGIEQISNVVQTNSATAEESAASSEELSGQAQVLKELVSHFKLQSDR